MAANDLPPSLHYSSDSQPGYHRKTVGKKVVFLDSGGKEVTSKKILDRISKLVIPPQWEDVWICKDPKGHIQAVGRDAKGRKQYIYHSIWTEFNYEAKYNKLLTFARCLPKIRKQVQKDLRKRSWTKEKVLALAVRLMDELYLRVGNKKYERENQTYGLTTLRRKHLKEEANKCLTIKYKAKSGKYRSLNVEHPTLKRLLRECSEQPGYELFRYRTVNGYAAINSHDVNEYLRDASCEDITAKTFRTWGGTVSAVELLKEARQLVEENPRRKLDTTLIALVAARLNNTVSVCRKYYIHPTVLSLLTESPKQQKRIRTRASKWMSYEENMVVKLLEQ